MNIKKLALAVALTSTVAVSAMPISAEASPRDYKRVASLTNESLQLRLAQSYIDRNTRFANRFQGLVNRFENLGPRYARYVTIFKTRLAYYEEQVANFTALKAEITGSNSAPAPVYRVKTTTKNESVTESNVLPEKLIDTQERIVEETMNGLVKVYAEVSKTFETVTVHKTFNVRYITQHMSNGTTQPGPTKKTLTKTHETSTKRTATDREFVREYAVVDNSDNTGIATTEILTYDEYMARDDVDYSLGTVYRDAMLNVNSRINPDYADRIGVYYGNSLDAVGAPVAWSRGYTGKGSTIAILDTGIDTDHSEFAGKIAGMECFTRTCERGIETIEDKNRYGHGTHVAGLAAAALDGKGTTGVAPDADLLIAKVAYDGGFYDFDAAAEALAWAAENSATVANMSGGVNVSGYYQQTMRELEEGGVYVNTDPDLIRAGYNEYGYNLMMETDAAKNMIKAMQGNEMVAVISAGNQRTPYTAFPAALAIAEDDNGELLLGGRMLIVGNWNIRGNKFNTFTNKAGTICLQYNAETDTCETKHRIKDFFLLAPGTDIASADNDGTYRTLTGTSMSAPMVSGGVAVVHQMWPHMPGASLVKLLLNTADKDLPGYDENLHGQGMMDLDAATQPQGAIGIPTTGRIDGTLNTLSGGGMAITGGNVQALGTVMLVDAYDRDFYFNANDFVEAADTRTISYTIAHKDQLNTNAYMGFAGTRNLGSSNVLFGLSEDGSEMNVAYDLENGFTVGLLKENGSFLGNVADSAIMRVNGATTTYAGYNFENTYNDVTLFGGATMALTNVEVDSSTMLKDMDTLTSNTANIGAKYNMSNSEFGVVAALPVAITSGNANFEVAQSVNLDGSLNYANVENSMASNAREYNLGAFYNLNVTDNAGFGFYAEQRFNYAGVEGETNTEAGVKLRVKF